MAHFEGDARQLLTASHDLVADPARARRAFALLNAARVVPHSGAGMRSASAWPATPWARGCPSICSARRRPPSSTRRLHRNDAARARRGRGSGLNLRLRPRRALIRAADLPPTSPHARSPGNAAFAKSAPCRPGDRRAAVVAPCLEIRRLPGGRGRPPGAHEDWRGPSPRTWKRRSSRVERLRGTRGRGGRRSAHGPRSARRSASEWAMSCRSPRETEFRPGCKLHSKQHLVGERTPRDIALLFPAFVIRHPGCRSIRGGFPGATRARRHPGPDARRRRTMTGKPHSHAAF